MLKKIAGIIIILIIVFSWGWMVSNRSEPLEESVLRLHVIANSDAPADQALKLAVKDDIVTLMQQEFAGLSDADEAKALAEQDIPQIKAVAQTRIQASGYDYPVEVKVGKHDFPTKSYGNLVFPPGEYEAVRVIIGEGQGKNWWCVLFPPLCLVSTADEGMTLNTPQQAQITFKCLELLPRGVSLGSLNQLMVPDTSLSTYSSLSSESVEKGEAGTEGTILGQYPANNSNGPKRVRGWNSRLHTSYKQNGLFQWSRTDRPTPEEHE